MRCDVAARRPASPVDPSAQMALIRVWLSGSFERLDQQLPRLGGKRRRQPAQRQREILPNPRIVVLRIRERLGQLGRELRLPLSWRTRDPPSAATARTPQATGGCFRPSGYR